MYWKTKTRTSKEESPTPYQARFISKTQWIQASRYMPIIEFRKILVLIPVLLLIFSPICSAYLTQSPAWSPGCGGSTPGRERTAELKCKIILKFWIFFLSKNSSHFFKALTGIHKIIVRWPISCIAKEFGRKEKSKCSRQEIFKRIKKNLWDFRGYEEGNGCGKCAYWNNTDKTFQTQLFLI